MNIKLKKGKNYNFYTISLLKFEQNVRRGSL